MTNSSGFEQEISQNIDTKEVRRHKILATKIAEITGVCEIAYFDEDNESVIECDKIIRLLKADGPTPPVDMPEILLND